VSFLEKLAAAKVAQVQGIPDPWLAPLQRVRGKIDYDGLERVSTQTLLDMLEVPQRSRTAGTYRRLAKLMAELGWTAVRVRDRTRGGYLEQVRGYVRDGRSGRC
jgi:hypothetical protein